MLREGPSQQQPTSLPRPGLEQLPGKQPMERTAPEYSSGLPSPYPSTVGDAQSEASSVDPATAASTTYPQQPEVRSTTAYPAAGTPTSSEYSVYPHSARSGTFSDTLQQRSYHPASNHQGNSGGMAQTPTSPLPLQDGRSHHNPQQAKSDSGVPIDPSIAAASPTTYSHPQYSPYAPPQDMSHPYPHSAGVYSSSRPDWGSYQAPGVMAPSHHPVFAQSAASAAAQPRPNQVYSFVPIPGAQQHKRPRRRYEEIERMYKCGWNGCEKAYGTLNHLNAHVTMQAHGVKRTPEEFKEIRKEWKARKKEEEAQRKAEEERQRQAAASAAAQQGATDAQVADGAQPPTTYPGTRAVQLPPIGYGGTQYPPLLRRACSNPFPNTTALLTSTPATRRPLRMVRLLRQCITNITAAKTTTKQMGLCDDLEPAMTLSSGHDGGKRVACLSPQLYAACRKAFYLEGPLLLNFDPPGNTTKTVDQSPSGLHRKHSLDKHQNGWMEWSICDVAVRAVSKHWAPGVCV
ncbi:hypothetical protein B0T21DRAFT_62550 [Apiosordaria backusii]|uniref:C2H2-type domain-containing protein n=1 Tax=Apiosordaria backusii TaxID=314023 RepID=A0AA40AIJ5_9PEZI|nr:hypothetical protein B0T21DRAFT_62550 [Apiosordaria backusii]